MNDIMMKQARPGLPKLLGCTDCIGEAFRQSMCLTAGRRLGAPARASKFAPYYEWRTFCCSHFLLLFGFHEIAPRKIKRENGRKEIMAKRQIGY